MGLECAGILMQKDSKTGEFFATNKRIMCLLPGGGYAQYVKINKNHLMEIPENISFTEAAAIPEVWLTSSQLIKYSNIKRGEFGLVHAACSGIGTSLMQMLKERGVRIIALCGTDDKIWFCEE